MKSTDVKKTLWSREKAASDVMERSDETRPSSATRGEIMNCLLQSAASSRRALRAPGLSLAQGLRACAWRPATAENFIL